MKPIILIVLPLVLFLAFAVWSQFILANDARDIASHLEMLEKAVVSEDWAAASTTLKTMDNIWKPIRKRWKALIDHLEVDRIDNSFARMEKWIDLQQKNDCLVDLAALKQTIKHIPEKERLTLSNIF